MSVGHRQLPDWAGKLHTCVRAMAAAESRKKAKEREG